MKVLVVDDSSTMRKLQGQYLSAMSLDVLEASDGHQALDIIREERPLIIVSDWNMPRMDGLELLCEVRKNDDKTPFIMVTTEAERSRVIQAIQSGVSDYIIKPIVESVFKEKLQAWIPEPTFGAAV